MRINNTEILIVYSAFHTGTWFVINLLTSCFDKEVKPVIKDTEFYIESNLVAGRSDSWIKEFTGKRGEELLIDHKLDERWILRLFSAIPPTKYNCFKCIVLQLHHLHGNDKHFFNSLCKYKPNLPIAIPVRDPLLSINSLCWRTFTNLKTMENNQEYRRKATKLHILSYVDLYTKIPEDYVKYFPIDIPKLKDPNYRIKQVKDLVAYYKLQPSKQTIEIAKRWTPSNTSVKFTRVKSEFATLKEYIIRRVNVEYVKKVYSFEISLLNQFPELKERLFKLGYKEFIW